MNKLIALLLCLLSQQVVIAAESDPQVLIRQTADRVLLQIQSNSEQYLQDPAKLYALVDEVVLPHFDFVTMTDLALGRYKNKITAEQKPLIINEFRVLLVRTYGKALLEYNDQEIIYLPTEGSLEQGDVMVKTEIEQEGGFPIPLNYSLKASKQGWKVYDISVDDISLVTNYRSSFARQIKKNGVDGLIKTLHDRNQEQ
jgi:phospholipid transport system substrate-binding protein